jgi:hypothetical protein
MQSVARLCSKMCATFLENEWKFGEYADNIDITFKNHDWTMMQRTAGADCRDFLLP